MSELQESDWKKARALLPLWRERYLAGANSRIATVLSDPTKNETERFWNAEKLIKEEALVLRRCLDDMRRSRLFDRMYQMRAAGMIRREDLADFTSEFQDRVFDKMPERND